MKNVGIDSVSVSSLYVEPKFVGDEVGAVVLSKATAFTVRYKGYWFLITNWHVVTGKNPETDVAIDTNTLALPNFLSVHFRSKENAFNRVVAEVPLFDEDGPVWIEHVLGREVDVVAIPLFDIDPIQYHAVDIDSRRHEMITAPGLPVSIVGFPFGLWNGPAIAIWKTGTIASDVDVDFKSGKRGFLVDASTRSGMSGSPVIMRAYNGYHTADNRYVMSGIADKFLGVYSGRLRDDSDIGMVWRADTLIEILDRVEREGDKIRYI